eukprot:scaffold345735_cov37-Prasinocladus_malaysianus.AAC.1
MFGFWAWVRVPVRPVFFRPGSGYGLHPADTADVFGVLADRAQVGVAGVVAQAAASAAVLLSGRWDRLLRLWQAAGVVRARAGVVFACLRGWGSRPAPLQAMAPNGLGGRLLWILRHPGFTHLPMLNPPKITLYF